MNRITKGETRKFYDRLKRKERISFAAACFMWAGVFGLLALFAGCQNQTEQRNYHEQEIDIDGNMTLRAEWDAIYENVEIPHPPRSYDSVKEVPFDGEVEILNYMLEGTGITVFRIDPNNPEHQRRYRRHLEEPVGFRIVLEEDI